ncbi:RagB/SusD family nutrient uptake outer membrane protein [Chitinophaga sedimenti]|uniref:RagB/SusD family nutrient uptake outer membrane protein n=1 Tax=Chitinophaga sedimenti TaxID=2033606 RepID=UPI0020054515|nr:RagB/SusD family nutrient uptake outer membrane protein [Chitinophaga sedimenti]MCK7557403.1 RagB/SusD family nutrient uptake outer membrane protein [Chitinophaga sedimenti]
MPQFAHLNAAYEGNTSDVRFMPAVWNVTPDGTLPGFRTFYKYSKRTLVPIIRSSEMYLLAAELSKDLTTAFGHLNKVRIARGLVALPVGTAATLATEIRKEYVREFFGEGQLFYYYKRLYIKTITDGSAANTTTNITMTPAKYVVPIPDDELSVHRP